VTFQPGAQIGDEGGAPWVMVRIGCALNGRQGRADRIRVVR
jgi:hypothetical protein